MMISGIGAAGMFGLLNYNQLSERGPTVVPEVAEARAIPSAVSPASTGTGGVAEETGGDEDSDEGDDFELPSCTGPAQVADGDPLEDWSTIVLDPTRGIEPDFAPPDLVEFDPEDTPGEIVVRDVVVDDLADLLDSAIDNGTPLTLISGYRDFSRQNSLFDQLYEERGEAASETIALPGHSEHQLGTAVDVLRPHMTELSTEFGETAAGEWLAENAHEYGFVISYPDGGEDTTCYAYEPWHLRYVGTEVAGRIIGSDLSPREWMLQDAAQ